MRYFVYSFATLVFTSCAGNSETSPDDSDSTTANHADTAIQIVNSDTLVLHEADSIYLYSEYKNDELVYGYKNREGKTIIKPQFYLAGEFHNRIAPVIKGKQHGLCDTTGEMIHVFDGYEHKIWYHELGGFYEYSGATEGMYMVTNDEKVGFVNSKNELVIPIEYENARQFSEGYAAIMKNEKYGYVDSLGNLTVQHKYAFAGNFSEGLADVEVDEKIGFIDKSGNMIIKPQFTFTYSFSEGLCVVSKTAEGWGGFYYIDKTGKTAIPGPFEEADPFINGEAFVQKRGTCRVIDLTGKELRKLDYDCFGRC